MLPAIVAQARKQWSLTLGEPFQPGGQTAWVAPARNADGADLVLKVAWPHPEAAHEADGLRAWAGRGAVRLHAAHDFGEARLQAAPRDLARRLAGLLDLDPDRVLSWLFARCAQESAGWPALAEVARTIAP